MFRRDWNTTQNKEQALSEIVRMQKMIDESDKSAFGAFLKDWYYQDKRRIIFLKKEYNITEKEIKQEMERRNEK